MDGFFERLLDRLEEMNLIRADLCRALGISEGTVRNWKKGVMPAADTALKIAQYLDVSLEYLITGKENQEIRSGFFGIVQKTPRTRPGRNKGNP